MAPIGVTAGPAGRLAPVLAQHERGEAAARDRSSAQWLGAEARHLCQAGSGQSQRGCARTPELLPVRNTQVHSKETLERPWAMPARFDTATRESERINCAKAPLLQSQLGVSPPRFPCTRYLGELIPGPKQTCGSQLRSGAASRLPSPLLTRALGNTVQTPAQPQ